MSYCDACGSGTHDESDHDKSTHSKCISKQRVREAIKKLHKEIRLLPNRDDKLYSGSIRICTLDGGGLNRLDILRKLDKLIQKLEKGG